MKIKLLLALLLFSISATAQSTWTNTGVTPGLQQRVVNGKIEHRFIKSSPYPPFGITDSINLKAPLSGGTNYIQNQNVAPQTANSWISGNSRIDGNIISKRVVNNIDTSVTTLAGATSEFNGAYATFVGGDRSINTGNAGIFVGDRRKNLISQNATFQIGIQAVDNPVVSQKIKLLLKSHKDTLSIFTPLSLQGSYIQAVNSFTGISGKDVIIGSAIPTVSSARLAITQPVNLTNNGHHTFGSYESITNTGSNPGSSAYADYDSKSVMSGSVAYNHNVGFQSRNEYAGSGGLTNYMYGFDAINLHSGNSNITRYAGLHVNNISRTGTASVTDNAGIWLDNITGGTNNYAIYSAGGNSYFAGNIGIGVAPDPLQKLKIKHSASGYAVYIEAPTTSNNLRLGFQGGEARITTSYDGSVPGDSYQPLSFWTSDVKRMQIAVDGSVNFYGKATAASAPTNSTDLVRKIELDTKASLTANSFNGDQNVIGTVQANQLYAKGSISNYDPATNNVISQNGLLTSGGTVKSGFQTFFNYNAGVTSTQSLYVAPGQTGNIINYWPLTNGTLLNENSLSTENLQNVTNRGATTTNRITITKPPGIASIQGTADMFIDAGASGTVSLNQYSGMPTLMGMSGGKVGIGTAVLPSVLTVAGGDIETSTISSGIILKAPNGSRWRITVSNTGVLTTTAL